MMENLRNIKRRLGQRTYTYIVRGSIIVQMTSCLTGVDMAEQVKLLLIKHKQSS